MREVTSKVATKASSGSLACTSSFYAFDFVSFERTFPGLSSCAFSAHSHAIDEVTRLLPQRCRAATPQEADFLFPPPYFYAEHNWPFYCKKMDRELNSGKRDLETGNVALSHLTRDSGSIDGDWQITVAEGHFNGTSDLRCRQAQKWAKGEHSCTHIRPGPWPTRLSLPAAVEEMLMNASTWKKAFGVDFAAGAKLVLIAHQQTPLAGLREWEEYPYPESWYTAPHLIWAKVGSRSWYQLDGDTHTAAAYRAGHDISQPPPAQPNAYKLAALPLQPIASKPYLIGFIGNLGYPRHHVRTLMRHLHNGQDIQLRTTRAATGNSFELYAEFMMNTTFAIHLRGDTKWTHRLIETICAGSIPVLITDYLVPPFEDSVPWESYGILINQSQWNETVNILQAIPMERRRHLQHAARRACNTMFKTVPLQIQHVLQTVTSRTRVPCLSCIGYR